MINVLWSGLLYQKRSERKQSPKIPTCTRLRPRFCRHSPPDLPACHWLVGGLALEIPCSRCVVQPVTGDCGGAESWGPARGSQRWGHCGQRFVFFTIESTSQKPPHLAILPVKTPSNPDSPPAAQFRPELSRYFVLEAIAQPHQHRKHPDLLKVKPPATCRIPSPRAS